MSYERNPNVGIYQSIVAGEFPQVDRTMFGRIFINTADGKVYATRYDSSGNVEAFMVTPEKRWGARLTQVVEDNPSGIVFADDIGGAKVYRIGVGVYLVVANVPGTFTQEKTFPNDIGEKGTLQSSEKVKISYVDEEVIKIETFDDADEPADGVLNDLSITIFICNTAEVLPAATSGDGAAIEGRINEAGDKLTLLFNKYVTSLSVTSFTIGDETYAVEDSNVKSSDRRLIELDLDAPVPLDYGNTTLSFEGEIEFVDGGTIDEIVDLVVYNDSKQ